MVSIFSFLSLNDSWFIHWQWHNKWKHILVKYNDWNKERIKKESVSKEEAKDFKKDHFFKLKDSLFLWK